jgi:hypothetical protein
MVSDNAGLQKGKNYLRVQVADFAGNHQEKNFHFHLK